MAFQSFFSGKPKGPDQPGDHPDHTGREGSGAINASGSAEPTASPGPEGGILEEILRFTEKPGMEPFIETLSVGTDADAGEDAHTRAGAGPADAGNVSAESTGAAPFGGWSSQRGRSLPPDRPYERSLDHLWDELCRVDMLVRAQTIRWRMMVGMKKPEHMWGMVHVTDAEMLAYLRSRFLPPSSLPEWIAEALEGAWQTSAEWGERIRERLTLTPPECDLRLWRLQNLFQLSDLQRDLILVCLLPELDPRYRRLFGYLMDDASRMQPTVELALQILQPLTALDGAPDGGTPSGADWQEFDLQAARAALDPNGALLSAGLLVIGGEARGDETLSMRSLRLDDRVTAFLLGSDEVDPRLGGILSLANTPQSWLDLPFPEGQLQTLFNMASWLGVQARAGNPQPVLFLHGTYGSGRLKAAQAICTEMGMPLLVASVQAALKSTAGWDQVVDLAYREAAMQNAALFWRDCDMLLDREADRQNGAAALRWEKLVATVEWYGALTFLSSQVEWDPAGRFHTRPFLKLEFPTQPFPLRVALWERYLPSAENFTPPLDDRSRLARELSNDFQFSEGQILDALATARSEAARRNPFNALLTEQDIYEGCRRQAGRSLVTFARRIEPRSELTFNDLVLPPANRRQLEELSQRIQLRNTVYSDLGFERRLSLGRGLIALFTGASGTGKTMAAELLARQRGVDLYKVDLSAVSSKWVGETEKNLSKVFDEAEESNAIIFFDEADALFGKRGEVKEAQDRWANMEVNYLLQRVEEYAGVVILASNLRQNIDEAFLRRIHWLVDFPFPDEKARLRIYKRLFPSSVQPPREEGLRVLAERFRLTGGSIKNVVVDATFRALAEGPAQPGQPLRIRMRHMVLATAREYQKLGNAITRSEFGDGYYSYIDRTLLSPPAEQQ